MEIDLKLSTLFSSICSFCNGYNKLPGLKTNDKTIVEVYEYLRDLTDLLKSLFTEFEGVELEIKFSKGSAIFPRVPWIAILPPKQKVSHGVYYVVCFGRNGLGAVAGCISSVTYGTSLKTISRSKLSNSFIDVDGNRATTKYNNAFFNPLEFYVDNFNSALFIKHIKNSLKVCFEQIHLSQDLIDDESLDNSSKLNYDLTFLKIEDTRKKYLSAIILRQGQGPFRTNILKAYDYRCAISGTDVIEALEASHIYPYKGDHTNSCSNGLLLRADLHNLFDLKLITISLSYTVIVSESLLNTFYGQYNNKPIHLPTEQSLQPDKTALSWRLLIFNKHNSIF